MGSSGDNRIQIEVQRDFAKIFEMWVETGKFACCDLGHLIKALYVVSLP